jgi:hypothetical protein
MPADMFDINLKDVYYQPQNTELFYTTIVGMLNAIYFFKLSRCLLLLWRYCA